VPLFYRILFFWQFVRNTVNKKKQAGKETNKLINLPDLTYDADEKMAYNWRM